MTGRVQAAVLAALASGPMTCKGLAAATGVSAKKIATMIQRYERNEQVRRVEGSRTWGATWELVDQEQLQVDKAKKLLARAGYRLEFVGVERPIVRAM